MEKELVILEIKKGIIEILEELEKTECEIIPFSHYWRKPK